MGFPVCLFNIQAQGPDINLGGSDIHMAQHLLDRPDVRTVFHQHRCYKVCRNVWAVTCFFILAAFRFLRIMKATTALDTGLPKEPINRDRQVLFFWANLGLDLGDMTPAGT